MPRKGGAAKAYKAMGKTYGKAKGQRVFYAKAQKGKGKSMHAKAQSYYKKGGQQR